MARIDDLVAQVPDKLLRQRLQSALADMKKRQRFGLVYEEHVPETTTLLQFPVQVGATVQRRSDLSGRLYQVKSLTSRTARVEPEAGGEEEAIPLKDLLVVKRFGDPIFPTLTSLGAVRRGTEDKPHHAVINGENFHALQLLVYLYEGQVDCIYIDPPYNTGARDWKYNNSYVDKTDSWRHSKWLSFMEKRLKLAKRLLKKDGVLIVTIDEHEVHHLGMLLEKIFPEYLRYTITAVINPKGTFKQNFGRVDEQIFFVVPDLGRDVIVPRLANGGEHDTSDSTEHRLIRRLAGLANVEPDVLGFQVADADEQTLLEEVLNETVDEGEAEAVDLVDGDESDTSADYEDWFLRRRGQESSYRHQRHKSFYAKDSKAGDLQAVCLASTTGSGKTVMLTSAIEKLLSGDDDNAPISDATFLWITDQPELNEQTRKKMLGSSSVLDTERLIVIDAAFDQETLRPGSVHFLNTQKLGKDKGLVSSGDKRTYTLWETVRNTIDARPGKFFVVIDEAHRGMTEDKGAAEATSIIQKFIKGSVGEVPPVPVVVGISATPERFNLLIVGTGRSNRPVDVDVADVRESGLIKDTIILRHPSKEQPTDMTMLREAARALKKFKGQWADYCAKQEEFTVDPLLVIQVEDSASKGQLSETDLAQALSLLRDELGALPSDAFAHAFQEGVKVTIGGEEIRYLAPSEIDADKDVRVVFFKTSLNLGWDCPRAEVMMSFRRAADATYIAQLVGRMVRTPLARRIVADEVLNTVPLYLPHYDAANLAKIVAKLSKPDDGMPPVEIKDAKDVAELVRAVDSEKAFEALMALPSYVIPRKRKSSQVRRLMKLARLLTNDDIDDDALASAKKTILKVLDDEYAARKTDAAFIDLVDGKRQIEIEAVNWDVGTDATHDGDKIKVDVAAENVDDLFEATGRKLNEGLHMSWWRARIVAGATDKVRTKLELFALCTDPDVMHRVEKVAQETVQKWLSEHKDAIQDLDEGSQSGYSEVRNLAASPELAPLVYPTTLQVTIGSKSWPKHLYVNESGSYLGTFNKEEAKVLDKELASPNVVGWLRNYDRKSWAVCVPYELDGEDKPMYPDFLIVRKVKSKFVVDMVEPHSISLADAPAKTAGLARFAAKHADKFGRIELILIDGTTSKKFDLTNETVRNKLKGVKSADTLKQLMAA